MKKRGRIMEGDSSISEVISIDMEMDDSGWRGSFAVPKGVDLGQLPGGIGRLQLIDGTEADLYILNVSSSGRAHFHCPDAPN